MKWNYGPTADIEWVRPMLAVATEKGKEFCFCCRRETENLLTDGEDGEPCCWKPGDIKKWVYLDDLRKFLDR